MARAAPATHRVLPHRTAWPGIEALSLRSDHGFPRHAHDAFGLGLLVEGA